jgi:preprotein translocase subunit SecB
MADDDGFGVEQQANGADNQPQAGLLSQYVKDLSFENPNAPAVFQWQTQPQIEVNVNIGLGQLAEEIHEVQLHIEVRALADGQTAFAVDLLYAGIVAMRNVPEDQVQPFLLAEAPRLLFPFARQIVSQTVQHGGFPPLLLEPIDFHGLYLQRSTQGGIGQESEGEEAQSGGPVGSA